MYKKKRAVGWFNTSLFSADCIRLKVHNNLKAGKIPEVFHQKHTIIVRLAYNGFHFGLHHQKFDQFEMVTVNKIRSKY